jgi:hypothetical protein
VIWHIFKKDWLLMWRYAAGLVALQFAGMAALLGIGRFHAAPFIWVGAGTLWDIDEGHAYYAFTNLFVILSYLASAFLITAIVQQDAIPGVRQDWLVRPILRRHLLLAKLLGALLMVLATIFLADFAGALLNGFPVGQSIGAALGHSVWLWFSLFLAVFALASLTKNLMEAIVAGVAVTGVYTLLPTARLLFSGPNQIYFLHGRVDWMNGLIHTSIILAGAATLLAVQYFLRKTFASRLLTAGFVVFLLLIPPIPWQTAFAIEERLSPNPSAGNAVNLSFVPDRETPLDRTVGPMPDSRVATSVLLPIRVTGVPNGAILYGDSSEARIIAQGETKAALIRHQMGLPTLRDERPDPNKPFTYVIAVPGDVYTRLADQPVRLEIDYQLSLLKLADTQTLPAISGDQRTPRLGWCGTRVREATADIALGCVSVGPPSCISMDLVYPPTGVRNPPNGFCGRPDYSPLRLGFGPDALSRFTEQLPYGTPGGVDQYAVKAPMLPQSQVIVKMYEPEDHFERRLTIPQIRLKDWAAE